MHAVFLDFATFEHSLDLSSIQSVVTSLDVFATSTTHQVIERCLDAEIVITNKVVLDQALLTQLPKLKLICVAATGTNNIDIVAAKNLGIAVTNVSGYASDSVAQYVFASLLEVTNHTSHYFANTQNGRWQQSPVFCQVDQPIVALRGKTMGIIGYGAIARQVEILAKAFGMKVVIAERPNAREIRADRTSFKQVLQQADVVSIHCPLTAENHHLFNDKTFASMKSGSILINTARGGLIDDLALLEALNSGQLGFAIIDVLDREPPAADHPLIANQPDNLKVTAHIAWASLQAQQALLDNIGDNILSFIQGLRRNRID